MAEGAEVIRAGRRGITIRRSYKVLFPLISPNETPVCAQQRGGHAWRRLAK
jgi:hypothetical protein